MKRRYVINTSGDYIAIPVESDGTEYCPICGTSFEGWPIYDGDHMPGEEICQGCDVQFGDDDTPSKKLGPMTTDNYYQYVRVNWLDKHGWLDWQINQLRDVLNVVVDKETKTVPLICVKDLMAADQT